MAPVVRHQTRLRNSREDAAVSEVLGVIMMLAMVVSIMGRSLGVPQPLHF